ncbi:MAG: Gfo/Idh/MocA family oxidoreductase [Ruminococcaceae bacterium]|nr:Gfo/Idh/MocA family oxidoreductase [Oscillospiraceae bacterium]
MRKIRIAQIGVNRNSHGHSVFKTLCALPEIFEVVGYTWVENEEKTCADQLKYFQEHKRLTLDEILNDETIEAVAVETDEIHLLKYAQMAAEKKKHIHMEKPGSQDLEAFERLIETVRRNNTVLHLGYMYRYNPEIARVIENAKNGVYGELHSVEAHMSRLDGNTCREWFGLFKGGMMFYLGCHLIDLVLQIMGKPLKIHPFNCTTRKNGICTEDFGFCVFEYKKGLSFVKMTGAEIGGFERRQLVVTGSEGSVEIKPLEELISNTSLQTTSSVSYYLDENGKTRSRSLKTEPFHRYSSMMEGFASIVRGDKENPWSLDYELELFKTILIACGM